MTTLTQTRFGTDSTRWQAVLDRDPAADGHFITCVHTTGIYCRPTCPARKPLRKNVHFVESAAEARREGYRACKRCKPDDSSGLAERQATMIGRICQRIEAHDGVLSLDEMAALAGMSRFHFHRLFKQVTGVTPKAYETAHRNDRVRNGLVQAATVTEAMHDAGFNSNGRFYAATGEMLGMTPGAYRSGGRGVSIRYAFGEITLGVVLVASTERGVCSIMIGDDERSLLGELQQRLPNAEYVAGDLAYEQTVAEVIYGIEEPARGINLPLDVRGTAFQQRVWQALREIPAGSTASYGEIAARIGSPKSARAVASACAKNNLAVAIPCHRAVGKDGSLTGYRWGTDRKRELLDREQDV
jgi:AraC family transcriptional regulator of adaptative response/methylated-DNA-[protein]-cysteine methyltransferase